MCPALLVLALATACPSRPQGPRATLEAYLAVKQNNPDIPLFNSECEVLSRGIKKLWGALKKHYNIPASSKIQAGVELSDALKGLKGDEKDHAYNTLIRLQTEVDDVVTNCLQTKSKAY